MCGWHISVPDLGWPHHQWSVGMSWLCSCKEVIPWFGGKTWVDGKPTNITTMIGEGHQPDAQDVNRKELNNE
jgi:hypothetical protein